MARTIKLIMLVILLAGVAKAREQYPGQYAQQSPEIKSWFNSQKSPKTHLSCCSQADGVTVEEDIRQGHYWVRGGPFKEWTEVPDDVVINEPNINGAPVVWWRFGDGDPSVYCFSPGGGT